MIVNYYEMNLYKLLKYELGMMYATWLSYQLTTSHYGMKTLEYDLPSWSNQSIGYVNRGDYCSMMTPGNNPVSQHTTDMSGVSRIIVARYEFGARPAL